MSKAIRNRLEGSDERWCVYALCCRNDYIYIGSTNNLERRLEQHRRGTGSKFVRAHLPFELVRVIPCKDSRSARSTEQSLKQLRRNEKLVALGLDPS